MCSCYYQRRVKQIQPESSVTDRRFPDFLHIPNIILLGDPGSGKTFTFKAVSKAEQAAYFTVREFLTLGEDSEIKTAETVYLDGLDEYRPRTKDKCLVDELIKQLGRLGRPKMRLSCRAADWLGQSDLSLFKKYFGNTNFVVLVLQPLTYTEQKAIIVSKGIDQPEEFIKKTEKQGIEPFLENPQTLLMLIDIVKKCGAWPATKKDLFEKSTEILLTEHNRERIDDQSGRYSWQELTEPAGAICASLLISGNRCISLLPADRSSCHSFRSVPFTDSEKVRAALLRKAFIAEDPQEETVTYLHRTIAEFLGAKWLAKKLENGFPVLRMKNLLLSQGRPAPELRGLNAWLATISSEYFHVSVPYDPYGILVYGDVAYIPFSQKRSLLENLAELAQEDPWFREDWSSHYLAGLSGQEMATSFINVLQDDSSSLHLKSIILDAIIEGPELPDLKETLEGIILNTHRHIDERYLALDAILKAVPSVTESAVNLYEKICRKEQGNTKLKMKFVARFYRFLGPGAVCSILMEIAGSSKDLPFGVLRNLALQIPVRDIPCIMDFFSFHSLNFRYPENRNEILVRSFISKLLNHYLSSDCNKNSYSLWKWLSSFYEAFHRAAGTDEKGIRRWLENNKPFVLGMFFCQFSQLNENAECYYFLHVFRRATSHVIRADEFVQFVYNAILCRVGKASTKVNTLYESCLKEIFYSEELIANGFFERFYAFADKHKYLRPLRTRASLCELGGWQQRDSIRSLQREQQKRKRWILNKKLLLKEIDAIERGIHLNYLKFLAGLYFGHAQDDDENLLPRQRLKKLVGEKIYLATLKGFKAFLQKADLPSPRQIAKVAVQNKYYSWWYAAVAGMDELWLDKGELSDIPRAIIESVFALALDLLFDSTVTKLPQRRWLDEIYKKYPEIAEKVYREIITVELEARTAHRRLIDFLVEKNTRTFSGRLSYELLKKFPNARPTNVSLLIIAALSDEKLHPKMEILAERILNSRGKVKKEQRALWLSAGFLLNCDKFQDNWRRYFRSRKWTIWPFRKMFVDLKIGTDDACLDISITQLKDCIVLFGRHYPFRERPNKVSNGNKNPWDAAEFINLLISLIASRPDEEASKTLKELAKITALKSYRDFIKHSAAQQALKRLEASFRPPNWDETTRALGKGEPANIADLFSILLDQLNYAKISIKNSNTDPYTAFWHCDSHARIQEPEVEDICRNRLLEFLEPALKKLNIRLEPEGHMAKDKRADIVCLYSTSLKLPIEIKRDTHRDLWTACKNQLERLYARDHEAKGYGIYVVFWFGKNRKGSIPKPPKGTARPMNPEQLEDTLNSLIPVDRRHRLKAVVIDVSGPE